MTLCRSLILLFIFSANILYSNNIEEIVIIKYYEDNTSDKIKELILFDDTKPDLKNLRKVIYPETQAVQTEPFFFNRETFSTAKENLLNERFSETGTDFKDKNTNKTSIFSEMIITNFSGITSELNIRNNYFSYNSDFTYSKTEIHLKNDLYLNIGSFSTLIFLCNISPYHTPLQFGSGYKLSKSEIISENNFKIALTENFDFYNISLFSENKFSSLYLTALSIISKTNIKTENELYFRNSLIFAGINTKFSSSYNDFIADFSPVFTVFLNKHSFSIFSISETMLDNSFIRNTAETEGFSMKNYKFGKKWLSGISFLYNKDYFSIDSTIFASGENNPLSYYGSDYKIELPSVVLNSSGTYNSKFFLLTTGISLSYSMPDIIDYSIYIKADDINFLNFRLNLFTDFISLKNNALFILDNNIKLSYLFNYFGIIYVKCNLLTTFFDNIKNKFSLDIGYIFTF